MIKDKKLAIILAGAFVLMIVIGLLRPREVNWSNTFRSADKIPYGTYVLYKALPGIFGHENVSQSRVAPYNLLYGNSFSNTTLIFVEDYFAPGELDTRELMEFIKQGNTLFISANNIRGNLARELNINRLSDWEGFEALALKGDTLARVNFTNRQLKADSGYDIKSAFLSYYYNVEDSVFLRDIWRDSLVRSVDVLGTSYAKYPIFLKMKYGKGTVYLHHIPAAFTNYYMLKPRGSEYVSRCLSYIPQGSKVIWSEYYKNPETEITTPLTFILSRPPLKWAYYTAVFAIIIFVLFNIKRQQRVIPIVEPYRNSSLEFVQTVGDLYFHQSDHRDIAQKKINYLLEYIRNRYYLDTTELNEEFMRKLSLKSGIERERVEFLFTMMSGIQSKRWISDTELVDLDNAIDYFKKNSQ